MMDPSPVALDRGDATPVSRSETKGLALRVRGTEHDGRLVRLSARKCTIGSGENCTLRLRARGVDRVHCLILRGERGLAVRRWSRRTQLNGGAFLDAPLTIGDRLGIGPLELEVVETPESAPEAPPACFTNFDTTRDVSARLNELEALLAEQTASGGEERRRRESLETETESLRRRTEEAALALEEAQALLQNHQQQAAATAVLRDEFNQHMEEWQRERERLQAELEAARAALAGGEDSGVGEQLTALQLSKTELEQRLQVAEDETRLAREKADYWEQVAIDRSSEQAEEERLALKRQIEQLEAELQRTREDLGRARNAADRASPSALASGEQTLVSGEVQEAIAREAELPHWEETRRALEAERDDLLAQLAAAQEASAIRVSPEQFRAERREWEESLSELKAELEKSRRDREVEQARHENELAELRRVLSEKAAHTVPIPEIQDSENVHEMFERQDALELETARKEIEAERRSLRELREHEERELSEAREQLARFKAKLEERSQLLDRREAELSAEAPILAQSQRVQDEDGNTPPASSAPTDEAVNQPVAAAVRQAESAADVLARMGLAPEYTEEVQQEAEALVLETPAISVTEPAASPASEDDSIENYMSRLLQRVRGDDVSAAYTAAAAARSEPSAADPNSAARSATQPATGPTSLAALLGAEAVVAPTDTLTAEQFIPRSQAPEQSDRLAAMRDLANTSARSAIGRYTQARLLGKLVTRMVFALVAAAASVLLVLFSSKNPLHTYSCAAVAGAAGAFWFVRTLHHAREFVSGRRGRGRAAHPSK